MSEPTNQENTMTRAFRETHEARMTADPQYAVEYTKLVSEGEALMVTALRNARVGLAMWSMGTDEIDSLIGPMNEEDRIKARAGRGGPLWDEGGEPVLGQWSQTDGDV
jgi:hypothetical protein